MSQTKTARLNLSAYTVLVVGGSAGSFPLVSKFLEALPANFPLPVLMCLHRLKDKREGFKEALEVKSSLPVKEPVDKEAIEPGVVYVAPANYHMLVEEGGRISLSTTELVQYSRPSIDVLFESVADVYGANALGLLYSGANRDGALGMMRMKAKGAYLVVQDPDDSPMRTMPESAIAATEVDLVLTAAGIQETFKASS